MTTVELQAADLVLRPLEATDADALGRLFTRLSPTTIWLRFFQAVDAPKDADLRYLASVDHDRRHAVAAVDAAGEIVGVARYDRLADDPHTAEVAILVEDAWHHRGVGLRLMRRLSADAAGAGVTTFVATALGENRRLVAFWKRLDPEVEVRFVDGVLELRTTLTR